MASLPADVCDVTASVRSATTFFTDDRRNWCNLNVRAGILSLSEWEDSCSISMANLWLSKRRTSAAVDKLEKKREDELAFFVRQSIKTFDVTEISSEKGHMFRTANAKDTGHFF